jgi:cysteine-rich repeat protein
MLRNRRLIKGTFWLAVLITLPIYGFAVPTARGSEGRSGDSLPAGCEILGNKYVPGEKCDQGRCLVPEVNCCGNKKLDGDIYDVDLGVIIHPREGCEPSLLEDCRSDCSRCGDGILNSKHNELCDKGEINGVSGAQCNADCTLPVCGDGITQISGNEECDRGSSNGQLEADCNSDCTRPFCGNLRIEAGEGCDDGNRIAGDGCSENCALDPQCNYYRISPYYQWYDDIGFNNLRGLNTGVFTSTDTNLDEVSCLTNFWGVLGNVPKCRDFFCPGWDNGVDEGMLYALTIWVSGFYEDAKRYNELYAKVWRKVATANQAEYDQALAEYYQIRNLHPSWSMVSGYTAYGINRNIFFDRECNISFEEPADSQLCGNISAGAMSTPISLELTGSIEDNWSLVQFELTPGRKSWVHWRGSEETPLLVYNPQQLNSVVDGSMLFGGWTNLETASTVKTSVKQQKTQPWAHGFEALSALDTNSDGLLTGQELDHLSLWFDKNQNAISEPGELKKLADVEVTELVTTYSKKNDKGDLLAPIGFKQKVSGQYRTGASVDWFSPEFASHSDAISALAMKKGATSSRKDISADITSLKGVGVLDGVWLWRPLDNKGREAEGGGILYLDHRNGRLQGLSLVEQHLAKNGKGYSSTLQVGSLMGRSSSVAEHDFFEFDVEFEGSKTTSTVTLTESGLMKGSSVAKVFNPDNQQGKETNLRYTWVARRFKN